jgi:uncharacterized protein (TIGR00255 family)
MDKKPIGSMTGFGKTVSRRAGLTMTVEVVSRNGQALSVVTRLPETLGGLGLEHLTDTIIRSRIERGTVTISARLEAALHAGELDLDAARRYEAAISQLMRQLRLPSREDARLLVTLPGVLNQVEAGQKDVQNVQRLFKTALNAALARMSAARAREGSKTEAVLKRLLTDVSTRLDAVSRSAPQAVTASRERLLDRVRLMLAEVSAQISSSDVAREVSLLADKMDIAEEIARLRAHVDAFRKTLAAGGTVGRRLEFLAQEMQREASTMGAKANDAAIVHLVVDMKTDIKRLREFVQNLE